MSTEKQMGRAVLITGTDLGVGKTFVAQGIAQILLEQGMTVGVMKPVVVGWPQENGEWPADSRALRTAAGCDEELHMISPYIFEEMVAPQVSADRLRSPIESSIISERLQALRERYDVVLVEGVGGLAVPLDDGFDLASLAGELDLPVLVVTRAHVGTLNHTFLTVNYARDRGLEVVGIIANCLDTSLDDPSTPTNRAMIERMNRAPVLGVLPFDPEADTLEKAAQSCRDHIDLSCFLDRLGLELKS